MFASAGPKPTVGIAITPNVGLEMIVIDTKTRTAERYGRRNVEYNSSKREVEDYSALKGSLTELFDELDIPKKSRCYFVLPNVHFGFMDLPGGLGDEEVRGILLAKAEESYIFKKTDAMIAYTEASQAPGRENQYLVYTAIQSDVVTQLRDICTDLGYELAGVEGSYTAIFRGVDYSGLVFDQISGGENWNLLLVNNNSYAIFAMKGNNIFDYTEVPIAVKSIGYEETYREIAESIAEHLPNYPAKKLMILSQSDDISAGVLKTQITFEEDIEILDCNKFSKQSIVLFAPTVDGEEALHISPSAIGAATFGGTSQIVCELNILSLGGKGAGKGASSAAASDSYIRFELTPGKELVITPEYVQIFLGVVGGILAIVFTATYFWFENWNKDLMNEIMELEAKKASIIREIDEINAEDRGVDINSLITNIISNNKKFISYYDSLSIDIPRNIWLTYFYAQEGGNVAVEGMALGINDVYDYYRGIKNSISDSTVKLNKLQALTDLTDNSYDPNAKNELKLYSFEISNTQSKKAGGGMAPPTPSSGENLPPGAAPPALDPI